MKWKLLTPYCNCSAPLKKNAYLLGTLMPLIVLGIIPTVFAMIYGSMFFLMIGLVMIAAGAGDLMMAIRLLKYKSSGGDIIIYDHLFMAGAIVFEKVNN